MEKKYSKEEFNLLVFLDGMDPVIRDKVSAVQHIGTQLTVHLNSPLSFDEEQTLGQYVSAHDVNAPLSSDAQKEQDLQRYTQRAAVKNEIIAEMAAENMQRVRTGVWTVEQLTGLTYDPELKDLLDDVNTLSFELAYAKIDGLTNSLLTQEIKDGWKSKLAARFFL